jgi:hypothetical protein
MNYITVVVEYDDNDKQPSFYPYMPCLGGKVVGVTFDNLQVFVDEEIEQKLNG